MGKKSIWIALAFIAFGTYELIEQKIEEASLYYLVGVAFVITWLSVREGIKPQLKKLLSISSWILIIAAILVFWFLVRSGAEPL